MNENLFKLTNDFFSLMGIDIENLEINTMEENIYYIKLKTSDSSLVIGYSGKNLDDIRILLKKIFSRILGENIVLHIEVNDYLYQKDEKLYMFISKKIDEINKYKKEITLPFFNAYDRKKIHNYINEIGAGEILTKSIGEGKERRMHIYKKPTISIDLDGVGI